MAHFQLIPGKMPALYSSDTNVADISNAKIVGGRQNFTLEAKNSGRAMLNGKEPIANNDFVYLLNVVVGQYQKHDGMSVDLLAEKLGRSNDPFKILCLQRLLNNNDDETNLFDQQSDKNVTKYGTHLACGSVSQEASTSLFGSISLTYSSYHIPLKTITTRDDVKYETSTIDKARKSIQKKLQAGIPVRVGTAHHPSTKMLAGGLLQPTSSGGHFVVIVGCNDAADLFLYVDPWRGGSKLKYKGGIQNLNPPSEVCQYMGLFALDKTSGRGPVLRQRKDTEGTFGGNGYLEVIAGPLN
jgi:hypothetical protein